MFGKGYIVEYCMSLFQKERTEQQYNEFYIKSIAYIAQGVHFITHNTAGIPAYMGYEQKVLSDFFDYIEEKQKDERTAEEIVEDVLFKCGLGG